MQSKRHAHMDVIQTLTGQESAERGCSTHLHAPWWRLQAAASHACQRPAAIRASAACTCRCSSPRRCLATACYAPHRQQRIPRKIMGLFEYQCV